MMLNGPVLLESYAPGGQGRSFTFDQPVDEVVALEVGDVRSALIAVEQAVDKGLHAAGFLCYEAAAGLDKAYCTREAGALPLLYFALFSGRDEVVVGGEVGDYSLGEWQASVSQEQYRADIERVRAYIAAGDTYQVNYTLRLRSDFAGDARALYRAMGQLQQCGYSAFFDLGEHILLSASPELFFQLDGRQCTARPMKGTRPRGCWSAEDRRLAEELRNSAKDRAENVMVTDLLRNDLGRISDVGSVQVSALWETERYPTVWQLTSTVASRLKEGVGLADVFAALFPCGSITGAPKIRTMQIIAELERDPRGIYTGCMGYWSPGEDACFNVAIRTAHLDTKKGLLEYGVGSGVTWASSAAAEYAECLVKAQVMHVRRPVFHLLETMLCEEGQYFLLDRHMQRLADSAAFWGFSCDIDHVEQLLVKKSNCLGENDFRVRVLLDDSGAVKFEYHPLTPHKRLKVTLATEKVDSADPFLYHKTTHRAVYEQHLAARADCDDVVLHNERGELTECCIGNLVLEMDGERYTPPIESGLLAGTFRAELLARGEIRERVIKRDELARADAHYLINSVRRWVALDLI